MKRFWEAATVAEAGADADANQAPGWQVLLDGRPVRTPARVSCIVPVRAMADEIAAEWQAQEGDVNPMTMPMTRIAATALDRVAPHVAEVAENVASYGGTDLLCYRADAPAALVVRQETGWNPVLDWAAETYDARLNTGAGVMHIAQPDAALARLAQAVTALDAWRLTAMSELTTLSGSLVLGLAVGQSRLTPEDAWALSRIDEDWNVEQWGDDAEAAALAARKQADFMLAARLWDLLDT